MAYDDRHSGAGWRDRGRWRGDHERGASRESELRGASRESEWRDEGREPGWRGDTSFGGGWGNQLPRPQRLGDRSWRPSDDPYGEGERYGGGFDPGLRYGGPGYDASFGGPRFDRADAGSTGTHGVHPISTAFGSDRGGGPDFFGSSARDFALAQRDPHYSQWRRRRIAELDRDYEEYRSETQARFDSEFDAWRERRGAQRSAIGRVSEHMEVVGSDGAHVGTVDCVRGDDLVLTRSDPAAGGLHHRIPCGWIDEVGDKVTLNLSGDEARKRWREEGRSRALFEREDSGSSGPHILNRSFSGTYSDHE